VFPVTPVAEESFAGYLARRLVADQGFRSGTVPEAEELTAAADAVLTYLDGYSCAIVCIVDREREPSRRFTVDPQVLRRVGDACLKYTGTVNGAKLPMGLQVIEVGGAPLTSEDRERLERYRFGWFSKVHLSATHLDTRARTAWHNHRLWRGKPRGGYLKKLLQAPREEGVPDEGVAEAPERGPVLTLALLGVLLVGFVLEQVFSLGGKGSDILGPSVQTLWGLGGLNRSSVLTEGQWWRLATAPLLHGDLIHLALNGVCLWFSALVLEQMVGRAWLWLLFVVGGVGGGLLSLAINPPDLVSVGASGAIMGLLAAVLALSQRIPVGPGRVEVQTGALRILVPSLIPLATASGERIDFAAHIGGALAGAAVGLVLARVWRKQDATPPGTRVVGGVGVLVALAVVASLGFAAKAHGVAALELVLIPEDALPQSGADVSKLAKDLLARYPRDPRSHLFQSATLLDSGDAAGAEKEARAALAEGDILEHFFQGTKLPLTLHGMLARALVAQHREDEARAEVAPYCHSGEGGAVPSELDDLELCAKAP
jgi:rhomboid protease GluP